MARGKSFKVSFKPAFLNQLMLLPPDLNGLVAADHLVQVVDRIIESLDISLLLLRYKPGGTSSYHPAYVAQGISLCLYEQYLFAGSDNFRHLINYAIHCKPTSHFTDRC